MIGITLASVEGVAFLGFQLQKMLHPTNNFLNIFHKGGILLDGLRNIKHNHNHQESIIFCKSQNSTASERKYQCYVCQRTQGEHRDLPRKLRDLIKQEFSSTVVYFLDSGIRMHYDPEAIRSTNKVCNMWLSSLFTTQYVNHITRASTFLSCRSERESACARNRERGDVQNGKRTTKELAG